MKRWMILAMAVVVGILAVRAWAIDVDQGKPGANTGGATVQAAAPALGPMSGSEDFSRPEFEKALDLEKFRLLSVEHLDQVKIIDSWARQSIAAIRHGETLDGQDPVYTALDIAMRPEVWADQNIVYVHAIPIREQLMQFAGDEVEKDRILHTGLVSVNFLTRKDVAERLQQIGLDTRLSQSVGTLLRAVETFGNLGWTLQIVPPPPGDATQTWHHPIELMGNLPETRQEQIAMGIKKPLPELKGYTREQALKVRLAMQHLQEGWGNADAHEANIGLSELAGLLPTIDAQNYPSGAKRETELWYNRTFYGTVANVFLYFLAMTLFLMVGVGAVKRLEKPALVIFTAAVVLHLTSMGIRYWLSGRWPTQNEFESVMGSALLGCIVGLVLEYWKRNGLFGMAFAFVGFLATTGCMSAPYVFGRDIGGAVGRVAGILSTYWLYIHVNMVIASYALIAASFGLALAYLGMRTWYWVNPVEGGFEEKPGDEGRGSGGGTGAGLALDVAKVREVERVRAAKLETLDQANMVVLQMAFWFLGIGVLCGAVWADQSWGRPWGWDPKETFALVTWIVYLIIVHARFVVKAKGDWTAWMAVAGFAVMMFNWIGVNFFLAGLHSYA